MPQLTQEIPDFADIFRSDKQPKDAQVRPRKTFVQRLLEIVVYVESSDCSERVRRFLQRHPSFLKKRDSMLAHVAKRQCGNPACICELPFPSVEDCNSVLAEVFESDVLEDGLHHILSRLEGAMDKAICLLRRSEGCPTCRASNLAAIRDRLRGHYREHDSYC